MSTSTNSPEPTTEELQVFYDKCSHHDWYYEYSDDPRCYRNGCSSRDALQRDVKKHPKYAEIYRAWAEYKFSGPHTNTEKAPRPIRPE
jgi:hypothetical protein